MEISKIELCQQYEERLRTGQAFPPRYFQSKARKEQARILFAYLIKEKWNWNKEQAINYLSISLLQEYLLGSAFRSLYGYSLKNLLNDLYPDSVQTTRKPASLQTRRKLSDAMLNLTEEKRLRITYGSQTNRYNSDYAKKLSDTKLGEKNPSHILKEEQVRVIWELWQTGNYSTTVLGEIFGVKRQTITDIVYGRTWKQVTKENK